MRGRSARYRVSWGSSPGSKKTVPTSSRACARTNARLARRAPSPMLHRAESGPAPSHAHTTVAPARSRASPSRASWPSTSTSPYARRRRPTAVAIGSPTSLAWRSPPAHSTSCGVTTSAREGWCSATFAAPRRSKSRASAGPTPPLRPVTRHTSPRAAIPSGRAMASDPWVVRARAMMMHHADRGGTRVRLQKPSSAPTTPTHREARPTR